MEQIKKNRKRRLGYEQGECKCGSNKLSALGTYHCL